MKYQSIALALLVAFTAVFVTGCGKVVPPGKKVLILTSSGETKVYERGVYKAWGRDRTYFVDGKLNSFTEEMNILCSDEINMSVDVKSVICFKVDESSMEFIKTKVPTQSLKNGEEDSGVFELSLEKFYSMACADIIRSTTRNVISKNSTDDIRPKREQIESEVALTVRKRIEDLNYPIEISAILLSNIDYPPSVKKMREEIKNVQLEETKKDAQAKADLAEARRKSQVEAEMAKVRLITAEAQAAENKILGEALTPQFLMWRQFEVMEKMASELGEGTVFIVPYEAVNPNLLNSTMVQKAVSPQPVKPPVSTQN